jgi:hypothetical protein
MRIKKMKKTMPTKRKLEVKGYWVFRKPVKGKAPVSYYVEPYKRKKVSKKRTAILKKARHVEATANLPVLKPGWVRYEAEELEERVTYTYKIEILVNANYKYPMSFSPRDMTAAQKKDAVALQYWHSKFEPTIKKATVDFLEKVPEIRAYGQVQFLSIDLYRVSGVGKLSNKNWKLLKSFDEPEDVN